jgi:hypothetical protein
VNPQSPYRFSKKATLATLGALAIAISSGGCKTGPYRYGKEQTSLLPKDSALSPPVIVGGPVESMDRFEQLVNAPSDAFRHWRKKLASSRLGPLDAPPESTQQDALIAAMTYLEDNDLHDVFVEVHHHDPIEQWKRLEANPDIHPVWKYTDGAARVGAYAMFPPRVYRFDSYNPYTKTLSVNSKNPATAIYEAARAKNHSMVPWPGAYAAMRYVPLAPVGQQIAVTQDALAYVQQNADPTIQQAMVSHTFANITGTALLGSTALTPQLNDVPLVAAPASQAIGMASGNIASRILRPQRLDKESPNAAQSDTSLEPLPQENVSNLQRLAKDPNGLRSPSGSMYR